MTKLVIGCGYLGRRVAEKWLSQGQEVYAVTRSGERAAALAASGVQPLVGDLAQSDFTFALPPLDTVLFAVGHDRSAGHSIHEVYVNGLRRALDALPDRVSKFIYISSTGVYGQTDGSWVNEDSICQPEREGGRACLAAEQLLEQHPLGQRGVVLRLAGIYGPGRAPRMRSIQEGRPIPAHPDGQLNLIHVEDAARVVLAAEAEAQPPRLYVVSDGQPALRRDYYGELARLLKAPTPRFAPPLPGSSAAQRAASSKRIDSSRMLRELNVQLTYPSYREGLAAIVF